MEVQFQLKKSHGNMDLYKSTWMAEADAITIYIHEKGTGN